MLVPRVLAALVFAPALLWVLWVGGAPLGYTCVGLCALMHYELDQMAGQKMSFALRLLVPTSVAALVAALLLQPPAAVVVPAASGLLVAYLLAAVAAAGPFATRTADVGTALLCVAYAGGLLPLLALLRARAVDGRELATLAVFVPWAADTGAYFAGRRFGRRKLAPRLSPGKTWEGAAGGLCAALVFACVWAWALPAGTPALHWYVASALAAVFGLLGDLVESLLKRSFDAKDSSKIIPGHGGVLDRFDSVLFASWAVFAYAVVFLPFRG